MAETQKKIEAMEQEAVVEASANPQADAPKKNAVAAEPSHLKTDYKDLGSAVVKPTDSNPDASQDTKEVSGDPQQKSEVAPEQSHIAGVKKEETEKNSDEKEEVKEGEMPKAALDALKKKQEKEEGYGMKKASYHADADKETKKEETTYDVSADVDALTKDEDLSEDFKNKAKTIFEAAINEKVKVETAKLEESYAQKFEEDTSKFKNELTEKVDSYLNYVVEEWMKENEIALERGIKGEIAEDFISGLKKLFEDHYIDVPDEKYNVLEDQANKIEELEKKLNESIEKNVELNKSNGELVRQDVIDEVSKDLPDTAKEKFNSLVESIEFSNADDFSNKVKTIKESYFGAKKEESSNNVDDVAASPDQPITEDLSNAMAAYTAAISKTKDIKISNK